MVLTRIINRFRKQKVYSQAYKEQQIKISEKEVQQVLSQICENINFDILCTKTDIHNMNENVFVIESVTVTSFEEPTAVIKKEERKSSVWIRIKNHLLRR